MPAVPERGAFRSLPAQAARLSGKTQPEHDWRFSFCCSRDGCRKRKTPPSLRFLGRKVYVAAMVVLIAIMREGATAMRMRQLTAIGRRRSPDDRALADVVA